MRCEASNKHPICHCTGITSEPTLSACVLSISCMRMSRISPSPLLIRAFHRPHCVCCAIRRKIQREVVEKERRAYAERQEQSLPRPMERRKLEGNIKEFVRQSIRRFHTQQQQNSQAGCDRALVNTCGTLVLGAGEPGTAPHPLSQS